jgi:Ca-activated chloride channel family protein
MSSRTLVLAFSFFLSATALRAQLTWKPLDEALKTAQASGRLILLDFRGSTRVDKNGDKWIAAAEANSNAVRAMNELVLAAASPSPVVDTLPDLAQFVGKNRHLLVLDPWGGIILEPDDGFDDIPKFAFELNALRQQTPVFLLAAEIRRQGMAARATIIWAGGLLDAGLVDDALRIFKQGAAMAKRENDPIAAQGAQLGMAAINLRRQTSIWQAVGVLEELTAHPETKDIEASAWVLLGHIHRERRELKAAIDAYQHAFAAAPKPSSIAEAARRHLDILGSEPESEVRADVAAGNVHLLYPHREVMVGSVDFGVATSDGAARVEMFLDDARVAELTKRPFRAKVALGGAPHVHTVRAVAWDAQDRQLGEEKVTLNDRPVSLGISIVAPQNDRVVSRTTVEVQPRVPAGRRLAGVDLYWNQTKVATLTSTPFRYDLTLPSPSAAGFIRAVARDDSGATAEDAMLLNASGGSERVGVDAVQVYAIVQNRGRYIDGLTSSDFVVKEDGRPVTAQVQSGSADPISIGLALDTSASMKISMLDVIDYANEFVKDSLDAADQTFVVAFDEQPHLVQPLTSDRAQVSSSIYDMRARGGTAIWDAILYSLQQFRGVSGKRALVVFTDCIDNASSATHNGVLQYAREIGVPLYVVQVFTGSPGTFGLSNWPEGESNLKKVAETTGGAFFRFARKNDLPHIFAQIRDDTRGEYLLTYVSPAEKQRGELRKITVEVPRRRVTVRATSGYYPR